MEQIVTPLNLGVLGLLAALVGLGVSLYSFRTTLRQQSDAIARTNTAVNQISKKIELSDQALPHQSKEIIDAKKLVLKSYSIRSFYYLDEQQVNDLYPQLIKKSLPTKVEIESSLGSSVKASTDFEIAGTEASGKSSTRTKEIYEIAQLPTNKYNDIEDYMISSYSVIIGLEEVYIDTSSIEDFHRMCEDLNARFGVSVDETIQNRFVKAKESELAEEFINKLSRTNGFVIMQGDFIVSSSKDTSFTLSLLHPVNKYLETDDGKVFPITINIDGIKDFLTLYGVNSNRFLEGNIIRAVCFGKISGWREDGADKTRKLQVTPVAIY